MAHPFHPPFDSVILHTNACRTAGDRAEANAIGIRDGAIAAIGSSREIQRGAGAATRDVDASGRTVLPAVIDRHAHFHRGAVLQRLYLDFKALRPETVADVLGHVRERAATLTPGELVQGDSLSTLRLFEARLPDRHELEAAAPRNPVVLHAIGKDVVAANSAALAAAGITRDTPDPDGGRTMDGFCIFRNAVVHEPRLRWALVLGLAWSVQPAFRTAYWREWTDAFGPARTAPIMPLGLGAAVGPPIALNSDFPCVRFDPLAGIRAAIARGSDDAGANATHTLSRVDAWRSFTTVPAAMAGDRRPGHVEPGALADPLFFDDDPFVRGIDLEDLSVRATMVRGTIYAVER